MTDETITKPKKVKTGGRKKGSLNKKTIAARLAQAAAEKELHSHDGSGVWQGTAHQLVQSVYRNDSLPLNTRVRAAVDSLRFEAPPKAEDQTYVAVAPMQFPATEAGLAAWKVVAQHMYDLAEAKKAGAVLDSVTRTIMDIEEAAAKKPEPPK